MLTALSCKHEDPGSDPRNLYKNLVHGRTVCDSVSSTQERRLRIIPEALQTSLYGGQNSGKRDLAAHRVKGKVRYVLCSLTSAQEQSCTHVCAHTCANLILKNCLKVYFPYF